MTKILIKKTLRLSGKELDDLFMKKIQMKFPEIPNNAKILFGRTISLGALGRGTNYITFDWEE